MKNTLVVLLLFCSIIIFGQKVKDSTAVNTQKGEFSLGLRTTGSWFSATGNYFALGTGWQLRYRISERLNTEWFADWVTSDIGGLGQRFDMHIGESMMIYPFKNVGAKNTFSPYILGGFCGDYTKIETNIYFDDVNNSYGQKSKDRWSFATQLGLGTSYNITKRFDMSFTTQYVLHFGADVHAEVEQNSLGQNYLHINEGTGGGLEGHVFLTLSANYMLANFKKKKE